MGKVSIYALACPISFHPKYIGQTTQRLKDRLSAHITEDKSSIKALWIKDLLILEKQPNIFLLEITEDCLGNSAELAWIEKFESLGFQLLNKGVYSGRGIINHQKTPISPEVYVKWKTSTVYGDLRKIGELLKLTETQVKYIIETRKGTLEQIDTISAYFNNKKVA